jgi:hypothetical protein
MTTNSSVMLFSFVASPLFPRPLPSNEDGASGSNGTHDARNEATSSFHPRSHSRSHHLLSCRRLCSRYPSLSKSHLDPPRCLQCRVHRPRHRRSLNRRLSCTGQTRAHTTTTLSRLCPCSCYPALSKYIINSQSRAQTQSHRSQWA